MRYRVALLSLIAASAFAQVDPMPKADPKPAAGDPEHKPKGEPIHSKDVAEPTKKAGVEYGSEVPTGGPNLVELDLRDVPLPDALNLIAAETGLNLVASEEAAKKRVSINLRNVPASSAVEAIARAHNLWFRREETTGILHVTTTEEYQKSLVVFREEKTRVFTMLYPNAMDLAVVINDLFGDRVQLSLGKEMFYNDVIDVAQRFSVFDLLDQRSQGLGLFSGNGGGGFGGGGFGGGGFGGSQFGGGLGGGGFGGGGFGGGGFGGGGFGGGGYGGGGFGGNRFGRGVGGTSGRGTAIQNEILQEADLEKLTPQALEYLRPLLENRGGTRGIDIDRLSAVRRAAANIYVTLVRRNNQVIVRTSDSKALEEIESLARKIDVPTPQVLLEVKILSIDLRDGFRSVFDVQFSDGGGQSSSFSTGNIIPPGSDFNGGDRRAMGLTIGGTGKSIPSPFGLDPSAFIYQFVDNNFRVRMQLLEDRNRVTVMATPMLLVANNEVSRLFIGEERPIVRNISSNAGTAGLGGAVLGGGSATIEFRPVGTTLLITPNINADRTVTFRLLQENSQIISGGATIPVVAADGTVTNQPVDVVSSRTLTGTVVAKDGLTLALGGLIEEGVLDTREEVPVVGKIPVLGFFFRRQQTGRFRREVILVIRPFVLSTPQESEGISKRVTEALAQHPKADELFPKPGTPLGQFGTYEKHEALRPNPPKNRLETIFRFHSVKPLAF